MFHDVNRYVEFLCKNKLTQPQFLMMYCLHHRKMDAINNYKQHFATPDGGMIGENDKKDLIERGFIQQVGGEGRASDYKITEKFTDIFFADQHEAAAAVWAAYPSFTIIGEKRIPLTTMDRYEFANYYAARIDYDVQEHKEVLKDVQYGRKHKLINYGIEKFVKGQMWEGIRQVRLQQEASEQERPTQDTEDSNF